MMRPALSLLLVLSLAVGACSSGWTENETKIVEFYCSELALGNCENFARNLEKNGCTPIEATRQLDVFAALIGTDAVGEIIKEEGDPRECQGRHDL